MTHSALIRRLVSRIFLFSVLLPVSQAFADDHGTGDPHTVNFNQNWTYLENNTDSVQRAAASTGWSKVDLPHTWNAFDTVDTTPGYRRSASWYRKVIPASMLKSAHTVLYFEGANYETDVYLNGIAIGKHVGGYLGFDIDLTPHLKSGQDNRLYVRVSNQFNPNLIPSQKADFFLFGGLTRDVWLKQLPINYVNKLKISTPEVSETGGKAVVEAEIRGKGGERYTLAATIRDPNGVAIETVEKSVRSKSKPTDVEIEFKTVGSPQLWSTDTPNLYRIDVALTNEAGESIHQAGSRFGFRWFEMKPHQGFFVNGKRVLIRGTHRHEEHAGLGNALPNAQHRRDMEMIKAMGANFVRLGHYPQDPEVYRAADELGLIIWDELPWCRGGKGGKAWENNTERMLKQMIEQNYNHPSIAFWSLGNEIYWEEDFPGGGATELLNPYLKKLNKIAKQMDPTRLTTIRKYYPGATLVDSFSPSIWAGWYGGAYAQYRDALTKAHKEYPQFLHMEYGGSSHVGRHTETPISRNGLLDAQVSVEEAVNQAVVKSVAKDSDWNENYIVDLFDWHLSVSETFPGFAGNAQWAFKDFGTPLRPENPVPYVNMKGLVDREGKPKDAYYVFASYWSKTPFCYIESKTWTHRNGPKEGRDVTVFCNTESAELFLNGESLGRKTKQVNTFPGGGLVWKVPFKNGDNALRVSGFVEDKSVAEDTLDVRYLIGKHGKFDRILLSKQKINEDRWLIRAEAVDKEGNRVLNYDERAYFFNIGDEGRLLENYGTPTKSSTIEMASGFASVEFEAGKLPSTIEFRTQNIKGVYIEVEAAK